jgi:hypothetical protein
MPATRRRASPYRDHLRLRIEVRMYRIDNATATSTLPTPLAPGPVTKGYFQSGNPGIGQLATTVDRDWANATQEEFCTVIEAAGITLSKTDHTQLYQALQRLFVTRTKVTTNMTIYVSPTGNDTTGNGLTPGTAFATLQEAISVVYASYDWNNHLCTIQLANGTYPFAVANQYQAYFAGMPFGMPQFGLTLQGNPTVPGNVVLSATNANCIIVDRALVTVTGLTVSASGSGTTPTTTQGLGLQAIRGGLIVATNVIAMNCGGAGFRADNAGQIILSGSGNAIAGTGAVGLYAAEAAQIYTPGSTLTVTGFNASNAVFVSDQGRLSMDSTTFVGSATGTRYVALNLGLITTGGGGANYLPGSVAGVLLGNSVYT